MTLPVETYTFCPQCTCPNCICDWADPGPEEGECGTCSDEGEITCRRCDGASVLDDEGTPCPDCDVNGSCACPDCER